MSLKAEITQSNQAYSMILMKLSGKDSPGITAEITQILASHGVTVLDIGQAVIHQLLSLSLLFEANSTTCDLIKMKAELLLKTDELGLKLEFESINPDSTTSTSQYHPSRRLKHYALTLLADPVSARALHEVTKVLAGLKVNIDFIKRLSEGSFSCVEMGISSFELLDEFTLRKDLLLISKTFEVDVALQEEGLYRRAKRLVVLDMDSTLIQSEVIDELAKEKGVYDEVSAITHSAMMGEMNFSESLKLRCQALKGLNGTDLDRVYSRIQLTLGAESLIQILKKLGYKIAVISGGFTFVADRLKQKLGLDYAYANVLEIQNGILTGKVLPPIIDAQRKADLLDVIAQQEKIELDQVIAVGDGANDLLMLEKAGLGIAFNAKLIVREKADLALSQKNMKSILYLLGISEREVSEAISE
ncbi:MAG: phosphoserine phosphatase SerB [Bdellovibrionia bacterium]